MQNADTNGNTLFQEYEGYSSVVNIFKICLYMTKFHFVTVNQS